MSLPSHVPIDNPCLKCGKPALSHRVSHNPKGDPCKECGLPADRHRVKHEPDGDPCPCGVPLSGHIKRTMSIREKLRREERRKHDSRPESERHHYFIGIDGEGQGQEVILEDGRKGRHQHKYVLLSASDETGVHQWSVENQNGLSTVECLEFFLSLPTARTKFFTYGFNYDITKIIEDLDEERIYVLMRPEHEKRRRRWKEARKGPKYVRWNGYDLNLQASKFTVRKGKKKVVIWDILKFFQCKFVDALETWKIGEKERIDSMKYMKAHRNEFDKVPKTAVKTYCLDECRYIAELARKLTDAHTQAGLRLTSYYGAGSTSSAVLKTMHIQDKIVPVPEYMSKAVAMAFFGGRFEHSVIGEEHGEPWFDEKKEEWQDVLWGYDLSSAYPYQLFMLPCLLHARWEWTTRRKDLDAAPHALVQYSLPARSRTKLYTPWGPFPFRLENGSIAFPSSSGGGYVWLQEYLAGEKLFPNVRFEGAWVYHSDCDCRPFSELPTYYLERLRIGKEGPGIVLKLGMNGGYGKLAQSVGSAPFNQWIWAGMTTSGTRAQMLQALGCHQHWENMLLIATDGFVSRERLNLPKPIETGTDVEVIDRSTGKTVRKPLGGWEEKKLDNGLFLCRPGVYFPLRVPEIPIEDKEKQEDEEKKFRARGLGRSVLYKSWKMIVDAWRKNPSQDTVIEVKNVDRFCGAKSSISHSEKHGYRRASGDPLQGEVCYGEWVTRPVVMTFHPKPKRDCILPDGKSLKVRAFDETLTSLPYKRAERDDESIALKAFQEMMAEQPDGDFAEDYVFE